MLYKPERHPWLWGAEGATKAGEGGGRYSPWPGRVWEWAGPAEPSVEGSYVRAGESVAGINGEDASGKTWEEARASELEGK